MSDEPAPPAVTLVDPVTAEVVDVSLRDTDELAEWRDRLGDYKRRIDELLVGLDAEITARLDHDNTRSGKFGDYEVKTEAPLETVWDIARLGIALEALVRGGCLTRKAAEAALVPQPPPPSKPSARELKKLLAHADPAVVEAIDACRHAQPRPRRRVTVNRTAQAQRRLSAVQGPQEVTE